ncbi:MAG: hypothetical protein EAX96_16315 [Candidatus Lokiarchaeota archaeon]|nr:hypothetical protein [Candidatus Lokiarchaeota archaeon]
MRKISIKNNKFINKVKVANKSKLIGQQFSRLRMGQTYYSMIVSTISAISLMTLAFNVDFLVMILAFPIIMFGTFIIGYYLDKKNINLEDYRKQIEMQSRKLNVADIKNQEFNIMQTLFIIKALRENITEQDLLEEYQKYKNKWS